MRSTRRSSWIAAALLCVLLAPAPVHAGDAARLARGLETIQPQEISSDLYFFASDEMRGRDTPSQEQRVAARFVRARLERLGFQPGAGTSYFFEYPLETKRIDPGRSHLTIEGSGQKYELVFGRDYFFPSSRDIAELTRSGAAVFCGGGEREDYPREGLAGRWAICTTSDLPPRRRSRYAESAGAAGLIVVPDPKGKDDAAQSECERTTEYALKGLTSFSAGASREDKDNQDKDKQDKDQAEALFPQVELSLDAARKLFTAAGLDGLPAKGTPLAVQVSDVRAGSGAIQLENVCGFWPGSDPALAKEVLIVSAHYDHVGVVGGKIYPGADDNGSGSMGLLALAEALSEYGPMRRSVFLMWCSGEEKGLWGSAAWTRNPTLPVGTHAVLDLNIDMIGRNAPDYLLITPTKKLKEYNGLTRIAEKLAPLEGFPALGSADDYWRRSDHMNFAVNMKIPVAFLFDDVHADYHQPTDTPDKIDYDKIHRVVRLVLRMLDELQADKLEL